MRIRIVSTTTARSRKGNRVTALRWGRMLRQLGHRVIIEKQYRGGNCDLMIALHARRSFPSVLRFRTEHPDRPLVLALTGTDLYEDISADASAQRALEFATRLLTLQPLGVERLAPKYRSKTRVIFQSAVPPRQHPKPRDGVFEICVLAHLRPVKDPLRTAEASRHLPARSRIRVLQIGGALSKAMREQIRKQARINPRFEWRGEVPRGKALRLLSRCRAMALTSWMEGGANAISEALACRVPVLASKIPGSVGLLGLDYPGYFKPGNTQDLTRLLWRVERDPGFLADLKRRCARLRSRVTPEQERRTWKRLLSELFPRAAGAPRPPSRALS